MKTFYTAFSRLRRSRPPRRWRIPRPTFALAPSATALAAVLGLVLTANLAPAQAAPAYSILHTFNAYSDGLSPPPPASSSSAATPTSTAPPSTAEPTTTAPSTA